MSLSDQLYLLGEHSDVLEANSAIERKEIILGSWFKSSDKSWVPCLTYCKTAFLPQLENRCIRLTFTIFLSYNGSGRAQIDHEPGTVWSSKWDATLDVAPHVQEATDRWQKVLADSSPAPPS